ncbi:hypothetical protein AZH51_14505 [Branchiibius sp. NY16-3462-2]|nr:hypothetical protein AZH51_14505 [Branchiibius sp. NY16-3462-2]
MTTRTRNSHSAVESQCARSSMPRRAWLDVPSFRPSRPGSCRAPPQNAKLAFGSNTNDTSEKPAALPAAVAAARHWRVTSRCTMKIPGVSLIEVASPISTPRGIRPLRPARSNSTRAIRKMFTWPNLIPSPTGCRQPTAVQIPASTSGHHCPQRWAGSRNSHHTRAPSTANWANVHNQPASANGISANRMAMIDAIGG